MQIREEVLKASEERSAKVEAASPPAASILAEAFVVAPAAPPPPPPNLAARRANLRFGGATPTPTEYERILGTNDLVDEFYLERALVASKPICRIILRSASGRETGYATGFMVSPQLLLTNWHVFPTASDADNAVAEFNFKLNIKGDPEPSVRFDVQPQRFHQSLQELDFALVAIAPRSQDGAHSLGDYGYHRLMSDPAKINKGEWITIIQHPGGQHRQISIRENELIDLLPKFLWYKSDTAPGSSGAPCFNDSFQVVALHHMGQAKRDSNGDYVLRSGRTVSSLKGIDDADVEWIANEGLRISVLCDHLANNAPANHPLVQELFLAMKGNQDIMSQALSGKMAVTPPRSPQESALLPQVPSTAPASPGASLSIPLQLNISLSLGTAAPAPPTVIYRDGSDPQHRVTVEDAAVEKLVVPIIDTDYSTRTGYDDHFLGTHIPLPTVADLSLTAKLDNGSHVIPYEHFSVVMNKQRRLAFFTASNVDFRPASKRPEPGDYSRKGLTGLGPNDQEKWFTDPRIAGQAQLPDNFYTKDGGAFDKGHIVRREDVTWGTSRAAIIRANGDTFHVTNCSPQIADFNRSNQPGGIWGKLENFVATQAKTDTFTLFSGPVLDPADRVFEGKDDRGPVRIQIPSRFWKIVVANNAAGLQAFAFLLEQDLSQVLLADEEFKVDQFWEPFLVSIPDLEQMLNGVTFPQVLKDADQANTNTGNEVAKAGNMKRRKSAA